MSMSSRLYVHAINQYIDLPQSDKSLREELKSMGIDGRRMSRFTQLCLLGALPLKEYISSDTNIYLGAGFNSPSKFNKMFNQLNEHNLPSPLDFMANLNNVATFQLAQIFKTAGSSSFLAINQQNYLRLLQLVLLDLIDGDSKNALVGWGFEHYKPDQEEGSYWLVVNANSENAMEIIDKKDIENNHFSFALTLHNLLKFS